MSSESSLALTQLLPAVQHINNSDGVNPNTISLLFLSSYDLMSVNMNQLLVEEFNPAIPVLACEGFNGSLSGRRRRRKRRIAEGGN